MDSPLETKLVLLAMTTMITLHDERQSSELYSLVTDLFLPEEAYFDEGLDLKVEKENWLFHVGDDDDNDDDDDNNDDNYAVRTEDSASNKKILSWLKFRMKIIRFVISFYLSPLLSPPHTTPPLTQRLLSFSHHAYIYPSPPMYATRNTFRRVIVFDHFIG